MEIKQVKQSLYIAEDGKSFTSEIECMQYENKILENLKYVMYYQVQFNPERTEKGYYQSTIYVAVYDKCGYNIDILQQYCVNELHLKILGEGVMGYGYMPEFYISKITKEQYESKYNEFPKLFLSPIKISNYPENIDYKKLWNFK